VRVGGGPVGTSTGWDGPRWGDLLGAANRSFRVVYSRLEQMPRQRDGEADAAHQDEEAYQDWAAVWGGRWLDRLQSDLRDDPDAYGLRSRATVMGREFVLAFAGLRGGDGIQAHMTIVGEFVNRVAGTGTGVVDAVGRRAAVRACERLFAATGEKHFCHVYRAFFADLVAEFLRAVIAEEITAAVPALVLLDPSGQIAAWVAGRLVEFVPDPCVAVVPGRSVLELAIEKVPAAVDTVLGLREVA
jgi:hypothetical protein